MKQCIYLFNKIQEERAQKKAKPLKKLPPLNKMKPFIPMAYLKDYKRNYNQKIENFIESCRKKKDFLY